MPISSVTEDMLSGSATNTIKYPNPFFSLANNYVPRNIKTLFKFCRDYYHTNSFLRNVIDKLSSYPITTLLYDNNVDEATRNKFDELLHEHLKISSFLISMGRDYYTFGNSFVSTMLIPKRFLKCPSCGEEHQIEEVVFKLVKFEFTGTCPKCNTAVTFQPKDETIKSMTNFKLVRWAPENIEIDWNPLTNSSTYYYNIPNKIKKKILFGDVDILKEIPLVFLQALKKKKKIILEKKNLFHMKMPSLAEEEMAWGKPMILPALKEIYYLQTLKRGNEAIANEHIIPKKAIFPANTTTLDPFTQMNLGEWRTQIETQVKRWKRDPNNIAVFPIPIGYQELGGNAKMLLLTPEMKFLEETIITSMGVPLEFIKGGSTWTGSSVSMRTVENQFMTYREFLLEFLNFFLMPKLGTLLNHDNTVKLGFKKFKMADDVQTKQLMFNIRTAGDITSAKFLDELGIDSEQEAKGLKQERESNADQLADTARIQAHAQGESQVILATYQAKAQYEMANQSFKVKLELFSDEIAQENMDNDDDPTKVIDKYALTLINLDEKSKIKILTEISKIKPITYNLILERMKTFQLDILQQDMELAQFGNIPMFSQGPNTKEPGERKGDQIEISDTEKTKGQTRGTP